MGGPFLARHPGWIVDSLDLGKEELPPLTAKQVGGKYVLLSGRDLYGRLSEAWVEILHHIERFKTADFYLVSSPMWNYSVPYMLKHYIDLIVQPKHLFRYTDSGKAEGLIQGKKMAVLASRGGQYGDERAALDFQEPYLRAIFGLVGIRDISFVKAEAMDIRQDGQQERLEAAKQAAKRLGEELDA